MYGAAAGLVLIVIYTNMNFKMLAYIFNFCWYYNNDIRHDIVGRIHNYVSDLFDLKLLHGALFIITSI